MPQNKKPETPTEGGRVYWKFVTESQLDPYVGTGAGGYRAAKNVLDQVEGKMNEEAYGKLSDVGISAIGFEFEVSTSPPSLPSELGNLEGPIGLSIIWLTKPESGDHGPHVYLFAVRGEDGIKSLSKRASGSSGSDSSGLPGSLFVMHYGGDGPQKLDDWEAAFAKVGVDAGGAGGLLSGEVTMDVGTESIFSWNRHNMMWWGFVVDMTITEDGTSVNVADVNYRHYEWLMTNLGFVTTPGGASWEPPDHSFWNNGGKMVPEWGGGSSDGARLAASAGRTKVEFPSGESLPVVDGTDARDDSEWPLSQQYWDPNYSGNPLLDTSGAHRDKQLSDHFTVGEYASSGGIEFTRARIDPGFIRYLEQLREHVNEEKAAADEEYALKIGSGYRSWQHNREGNTYDWPAVSRIEDVEWGSFEDDGDTYEWKLTLSDSQEPVYKDLTRSEHCSGRGADIDFESTTYQLIDNDAAYLRDPDADPAYDTFTDDILNVSKYSNWYGDSVPDSVTQHSDPDVWKITEGTAVEETGDSATNPDGDSVVRVEDRSGNVLGWTNEGNLSPERNPGFNQVELAKMALYALVDDNGVDISPEGVHPCDPRTGVGGDRNDFHIDVKPYPWIGDAGDAWAYSDAPGGSDQAKSDAESHHNTFRNDVIGNCPSTAGNPDVEREGGIYGVDNREAILREPQPDNPQEDLQPATDQNNPLRSFWNNTIDVHYNSDEGQWELAFGIYVQFKEARTGPDGNKIAKVATPGDQILGWTAFSNLVYTGYSPS
jgi:hypothetical protein